AQVPSRRDRAPDATTVQALEVRPLDRGVQGERRVSRDAEDGKARRNGLRGHPPTATSSTAPASTTAPATSATSASGIVARSPRPDWAGSRGGQRVDRDRRVRLP